MSHAHLAVADGEHARGELVRLNERLVRHCSRRYPVPGVDSDDLHQAALRDLLHGIDRFDLSRGFHLSTCVSWCIRQTYPVLADCDAYASANHLPGIRAGRYANTRSNYTSSADTPAAGFSTTTAAPGAGVRIVGGRCMGVGRSITMCVPVERREAI